MRNSNNYQLAIPNSEILLSDNSKDNIQNAIAIAVKNGEKINIEQKYAHYTSPNISLNIGAGAFSLNIGFTRSRVIENKYTMKG